MESFGLCRELPAPDDSPRCLRFGRARPPIIVSLTSEHGIVGTACVERAVEVALKDIGKMRHYALKWQSPPNCGRASFLRGRRDFPMAYRPSGRPPASRMSFSMKTRLFIFLISRSKWRASAFVGNSRIQTILHGPLPFVDRVRPSLCRWHLRTRSCDEPA